LKFVDSTVIDEETEIPIKSKTEVTKKKIVGSRIDSRNYGYKPAGGNLKIYNKGLKFEDNEEPIVETYDRSFTKHQGVVQVHTDIDSPEEATLEVTTRPFEIEQVSRVVTVTREMKKLPTPPPEPITVIYLMTLNISSRFFFR
jgi:hypothetical protein